MANNFLQFSLLVPLNTKAELDWVVKTLTALNHLFGSSGEPDAKRARALGAVGRRIVDEKWDFLDFQWSIEPTWDDKEGVSALWLYAEETGEPEHVASVLEAFLAKFRPRGVVTFSWAYTCSKLRVNEFGGGAAVVTATGTKYIDAQSWADDLAAKFSASTSAR